MMNCRTENRAILKRMESANTSADALSREQFIGSNALKEKSFSDGTKGARIGEDRGVFSGAPSEWRAA